MSEADIYAADWRDKEIIRLAEENARLRERGEKLERAMTWYGENARLCRIIHREGDLGRNNLSDDGGSRASAALRS